MADDLYERDFYAWAQTQVRALRDRAGGANALDYDNLAEEVETLGRSERRACEGLIEAHPRTPPKDPVGRSGGHWRVEIKAFRKQLRRVLSPTLAAVLPGELQGLYDDVRDVLSARLAFEGRAAEFPQICPYGWDEVTGRDNDWTPAPTQP